MRSEMTFQSFLNLKTLAFFSFVIAGSLLYNTGSACLKGPIMLMSHAMLNSSTTSTTTIRNKLLLVTSVKPSKNTKVKRVTANLRCNVKKNPSPMTNRTVSTFINRSSSLKCPKGVLTTMSPTLGLGNHLFFYAVSYSISRDLDVPLYLPVPKNLKKVTGTRDLPKNASVRQPVVQHLILPKGIFADYTNLTKNSSIYRPKCTGLAKIASLIPKTKDFIQIVQYCFFPNLFTKYKKELQTIRVKIENPSKDYKTWKNLIEKKSAFAVAIHIRRGDITKHYWNAPIKYFQDAMLKIKKDTPGKNATFFVFSDEMSYAKNSLVSEGLFLVELNRPVFFVSDSFGGLSNIEEFDLMIRCKSIVISSSTFSWWAAYLMKDTKDKIVIRPKFNKAWHKNKREYLVAYPNEWIPVTT